MFSGHPSYDPLRPLRFRPRPMSGEDVYALQTALNYLAYPAGRNDGVFGDRTDSAVRSLQAMNRITIDGIVGPKTFRTLCEDVVNRFERLDTSFPKGMLLGQIEHESGYYVGNYTGLYPNGSYDMGIVQCNSKYHDAKVGFSVDASIALLLDRVRRYHQHFAGVRNEHRRWALAVGTWNAPAFACWIAREEGASAVTRGESKEPSATDRVKLESYMTSCMKYAVV